MRVRCVDSMGGWVGETDLYVFAFIGRTADEEGIGDDA